ncbi:hypothetical protein BRX43_07090 [Sphingomonas sp. S-NIH.Pt15_0812]|nr:hypothetical protein BRX43_07090 [Sphingomonas sp. S-NIH.Pt15_0812]
MAFVAEPPPLRRDWLAELLDGLGNVPADVDWLLLALTATEPKKQFETDPLADALSKYVASLAPSLLAALLEGISKLLNRKLVVEQRHCEISMRYSWLGQVAGQIVVKII